jgi:hypothetical protein
VPALLAFALLAWIAPRPASAQDDYARVGITVGGTSFVGVALEFFRGDRSIELTVGTWAARDLAISVVGRQFFGEAAARPVVGGGLWTVLAWPPGERMSVAVVLRAPVGVDWWAGGNHYFGFDLNVNRALWVRRSEEAADLPVNRRLVPLPGFSYRWKP